MKLFLFTKKEGLEHFFEDVTDDFEVINVNSEKELFEHDFEKCVIVIDIDTLEDYGFTLAAKLANDQERKSLLVGITSLEVDSAKSSFDFFFDSFESAKESFEMIIEKYEDI